MVDRDRRFNLKDAKALIPLATALGISAVAILHYARGKRNERLDPLTKVFDNVNSLIQAEGGRRSWSFYVPFIVEQIKRKYPQPDGLNLARLGRDLASLRFRIEYMMDHRDDMGDLAREFGIARPETLQVAAQNLDVMYTTMKPTVRRAIRREVAQSKTSIREIQPGDRRWTDVHRVMNEQWPQDDLRIKRHGLDQPPDAVRWLVAERDGKFLGYATYTYAPEIDIENFNPHQTHFPGFSPKQGENGTIMITSLTRDSRSRGMTPTAGLLLAIADIGRQEKMSVIAPSLSPVGLREMRKTGRLYSEIWEDRAEDGSHADPWRNVMSIFAEKDLGVIDDFMRIQGTEAEFQRMGLPHNTEDGMTTASVPAGFMLIYDAHSGREDVEADFPVFQRET